jgi:phage major head subunit gpT-like protein
MSANRITSRQVIGDLRLALSQDVGNTWIDPVSMMFTSDQESEEYAWLGMPPAMREWVGGRHAKGLRESGMTIRNKKFEATLEIPVDWMRRDKTGQIQLRIGEMAERANAHWASLLSTLLIAGETALCYDGQYFFDTDHLEGDSGSQSNKINYDIATTTAPTAAEMTSAILNSIEKMLAFKDDQGEPMNEGASEFLIMVPVPFMSATFAALGAQVISQTSNLVQAVSSIGGLTVRAAVNTRLTWTTKFATFRTDGGAKALIRQQEQDVMISAVAEDSELEFTKDVHQYGIKANRNVGYGYWQKGILTTFT